MVRAFIAGTTDYSHQSFKDILTDLAQWILSLKKTLELLQGNIEKLTKSGYLQKVDRRFANLVGYSTKFFATSVQEISEILADLQREVRPDHVTRLHALYQTARQLNLDYGQIWHKEYKDKEYGNMDFFLVEQIYSEGRDMVIDMEDLSNLSTRLEDFIGRKSMSAAEPSLSQGIDILELKPNFFGFGVNLNELIKRLFRRKE